MRLIPEFQVDRRRAAAGQGRPGRAARAAARWSWPTLDEAGAVRRTTRPTTVAEAVGAARRARRRGQGARRRPEPGADAGNLRLARFEHLVDIGRIAELRGVERQQRVTSPSARRRATSSSSATPMVAADVPLLARRRRYIGHFQIRNRGTIGGSLAHADPAAEYPAVARGARRRRSTSLSARGERAVRGRRVLHGRVVDGAGARRAAHRHRLPGVGRPVRASASPSSPAATATSPSPAPSPASSSAPTASSGRAPSPCSASAGVPVRATHAEAAAHRAAGRRRSTPMTLGAAGRSATIDDVDRRRSTCRRPTAAGSARRWWPTAWRRARRRRHRT